MFFVVVLFCFVIACVFVLFCFVFFVVLFWFVLFCLVLSCLFVCLLACLIDMIDSLIVWFAYVCLFLGHHSGTFARFRLDAEQCRT